MNKISKKQEITPREFMKQAGAGSDISGNQTAEGKDGTSRKPAKSEQKESETAGEEIQTVTPENDNGLPGPSSKK